MAEPPKTSYGEVPTQSIVGASLENLRLGEELSGEELESLTVEGLTQGFQPVEVDQSVGDALTHFDLGVAYKDMELFDEAIQEFQVSAADPSRSAASAEMLSACYQAKGRPELAIQALQRGLENVGASLEAAPLRFSLASAYEAANEQDKALEQYAWLAGQGADIPGLAERLAALSVPGLAIPASAKPPAPTPSPPVERAEVPDAPPSPEPARGRKKKISFI